MEEMIAAEEEGMFLEEGEEGDVEGEGEGEGEGKGKRKKMKIT